MEICRHSKGRGAQSTYSVLLINLNCMRMENCFIWTTAHLSHSKNSPHSPEKEEIVCVHFPSPPRSALLMQFVHDERTFLPSPFPRQNATGVYYPFDTYVFSVCVYTSRSRRSTSHTVENILSLVSSTVTVHYKRKKRDKNVITTIRIETEIVESSYPLKRNVPSWREQEKESESLT